MRSDDWYVTEDLDRFLAHAGGFLRSRPDLHTVALTVTESLRMRGLHAYGGDEPPVFGVMERDGQVRGAYFRTPPYRLNVTPLNADETDALAAHLVAVGQPVPGIIGTRETTSGFVRSWQRHTGATSALRQRQRLYRLGSLLPPRPVPEGRPRLAGEKDRDQLIRWYREFTEAVGDHAAGDVEAWADHRIAYGGITFWEDPNGTPVSMCGVTPTVAGQVRIAPVYTPPHLRGRGYAGAVTVEVSRTALRSGAEEVLLFTDLSNTTSNVLYQRIGYRAVADFEVYDFSGTADR
ncbi:GNAT family N-acetyltransferase [Streptomyces sp. G1]|uniref:GNAT family N-acetyltransferase n=1 Tax=Streptomyces sp. G1 TaxID=361572 RepID=UPI00202F02CE|nr:GNAT family N-acetyltransferase [Streptomyces sp. G1]MCM1969895.1 GNAT family N-acetyltransferase [Streptomyces sp. G1]